MTPQLRRERIKRKTPLKATVNINMLLVRFFVYLHVFLFLSTPLYAHKPLEVATFFSPPYSYTDEGNNIQGINVEIFSMIAKEVGLEYNLHILPWARALQGIKSGRYDILISSYIIENDTEIEYSKEPIYEQNNIFLTLKSSPFFSYEDIQHGTNLHVATHRQYQYGPLIDELLNKPNFINRFISNNDEQLFTLLDQNRIDLIPINHLVARYYITKFKQSGRFREIKIPQEPTKHYIAYAKNKKLVETKEKIDLKLREYHKRNALEKLVEKWIEKFPI